MARMGRVCVARQTVIQGKLGNHASHVVGSRIPDGGGQMWKLEIRKVKGGEREEEKETITIQHTHHKM